MEKQTRMSKYKELRETLNEEVAIQHTAVETVVEDDDFLAFIPQKEQTNLEDTLIEPKTFESINQESHVRDALNEAKVNVGKEHYNTRLDILNKIRGEEVKEEVKVEEKEPAKKMSLLERLAAMSPEEDVKEFEEYQESVEEKKEEIEEEVKEVREDKVIVIDDDDDEDEEKESKLVTFLNYVIIVFMIVFVILVFFIIKQLLF